MNRPLLQILMGVGALIAVVAIWLAGQYVSDGDRLIVVTTLTAVVVFVFLMMANAASGRRRPASARRRKRALF